LRVKIYYAIFLPGVQAISGKNLRKNRQHEQVERERELYEDFLQRPINSTWLQPACLLVIQTFSHGARKKRVRGKVQKIRKEYAQKIAEILVRHYPPASHHLNKHILEAIALAFPKELVGLAAKTLLKDVHNIII